MKNAQYAAHNAKNIEILRDPLAGPFEKKQARESLILSNQGLVHSRVHAIGNRGTPREDMFFEGLLSLTKNIDRFISNGSPASKFVSYVSTGVYYDVLALVSRRGGTIALSDFVCRRIGLMRKSQHKLRNILNREPENHEIAADMNVAESEVSRLLLAISPLEDIFSSYRGKDDDEHTIQIEDSSCETGDDITERLSMSSAIEEMLESLSEAERFIIKHKFGLCDAEIMTADEMGKSLGITKEHVAYLVTIASKKILTGSAGKALRAHLGVES